MLFANPVPAGYASGAYYDGAGTDYYLTPDKLGSDYADVRFERELRTFRKHCARGRVLDVGCSSGAFLFQVKRRWGADYSVLGTDASGPALDHAESQGVAVRRGDFVSLDLPGGSFDAVTFWAVLEHLAAPRAFVARAWNLLAPGGTLFALVPNLRSLAVRLLGLRYRYFYPQHLNYFTRGTFLRMFRETLSARDSSGFTVLDCRTTHFNPVVIWQDWWQKGREVSNAERGELLRRTTALKRSGILLPLRAGYRVSEALLRAGGLADNLALVIRKN